MMLQELRRCISTTQQLLAIVGAPLESSCSVSQDASAVVSAIAAAGLPNIQHPGVPSALATQLHGIAQSHFQSACLALLSTSTSSDVRQLQARALQVKKTFITLHEKKLDEAATKRSVHKAEKQPFANDILLYAFQQSQTPNKRERAKLAALTGLSLEQVRVWFQNRRQRTKKRAPELQARTTLQLDDVLERVAAHRRAADEDYEDDDSGYFSTSDRERSTRPHFSSGQSLTVPCAGPRSYPAPYIPHALSTEFHCEPPIFYRTAAKVPPPNVLMASTAELCRQMSRLTLRHRRQTPRSSTGSTASTSVVGKTARPSAKGGRAAATTSNSATTVGDTHTRKKVARKDPDTGRSVAGRRTASATTTASSPLSAPSPTAYPPTASSPPPPTTDSSAKPRKRLGPLRRKPAGKALARQASESSVGSTSSSDSSRSTSYSSDFSLASDSSFTSVESAPTAATMECFQPQQPLQFDPLAAFDFTQLFSSQPSDPLPQPVADFELPPDLLAGLQMPMDTAALPPPESTDFLALLNDPTIQDLLQSVQDMDVVAPQQMQESLTLNNTFDVGSVDTSAFFDLSATTLPTFDAMFGLDASSFQDTPWNSSGFSLPITA